MITHQAMATEYIASDILKITKFGIKLMKKTSNAPSNGNGTCTNEFNHYQEKRWPSSHLFCTIHPSVHTKNVSSIS